MVTVTNLPPYFSSALKNQTVTVGYPITYTLPSMRDGNKNDIVSVSVSLGAAGKFTQFTQHNRRFSISPSFLYQVGTYPVTVVLKDSFFPPSQVVYTFLITVVAPNTQTVIREPKKVSDELHAKIKSISNRGWMVIEFNREVLIPTNYTYFNNSILNMTVLPGDYSDKTLLNFNWTIKDFTTRQIMVQLDFEHPDVISMNYVSISLVNSINSFNSTEIGCK